MAYLEGRKGSSQQGQVPSSEAGKWRVNDQEKRNADTEILYRKIIVMINEVKSDSLRRLEQSIQLQPTDQEQGWGQFISTGNMRRVIYKFCSL